MTKMTLIAVDQAVTFSRSDELTPELIQAYSFTQTFAQAAARKVNPDPGTATYFRAMSHELQVLGWNVLSAGNETFNLTQNKISPAGIVSSILTPHLDPQGKDELDGILNAIQQPDVSVSNFLDFFWKHASTNVGKSNMAWGPLTPHLGQPKTTILYYDFNFSADSWRSMFIQRDRAELSVSASHITMNLNMALYNSVKQHLIDRITGHENEHIDKTELDL